MRSPLFWLASRRGLITCLVRPLTVEDAGRMVMRQTFGTKHGLGQEETSAGKRAFSGSPNKEEQEEQSESPRERHFAHFSEFFRYG